MLKQLVLALGFGGALSAWAADGQLLKVLPQFLDLQGRHTRSPSLYDRDAYQAELRRHPELRSGLRFAVQWKGRAPTGRPLKLRVELRGMARGDLPRQAVLETNLVARSGWPRWTFLTLTGEAYQQFGELTAWRAQLLDGEVLLSEQQSFLW